MWRADDTEQVLSPEKQREHYHSCRCLLGEKSRFQNVAPGRSQAGYRPRRSVAHQVMEVVRHELGGSIAAVPIKHPEQARQRPSRSRRSQLQHGYLPTHHSIVSEIAREEHAKQHVPAFCDIAQGSVCGGRQEPDDGHKIKGWIRGLVGDVFVNTTTACWNLREGLGVGGGGARLRHRCCCSRNNSRRKTRR